MFDVKRELICPACQTKMEKIFVEECGHYVDVCTEGCGGIYFDNRELEHFDEKNENVDVILKALEGKQFKKVDQSQTRICPVCGAPMVKNFTSAKREIEIDCCYSCGGKFLDNNELQAIRGEYDTESQRKKDFRDSFNTEFQDVIENPQLIEEKEARIKQGYDIKRQVILDLFSDWKNQ